MRPRRAAVLAAAGVLLAGGAGLLVGMSVSGRTSPRHATPPTSSHARKTLRSTKRTGPLRVLSISPRDGSDGVAGSTTISIRFSEAVSTRSALPRLVPSVPGSWRVMDGSTLVFTPSTPFLPLTEVRLTIPSGPGGLADTAGGRLKGSVVDHFTVADGSTLRLQQLLSLLDYSPLAWHATDQQISPSDTSGQLQAMYAPPSGTFSWRNSGWPPRLLALWHEGRYTTFTRGLVMEFQADHGLTVNGDTTTELWSSLLRTLAAGERNTGGYNYAIGDKVSPQTLTIWHDGKVALRSSANTGIPQSPTPSGTFPVYARYRHQIMKGTNPDGTHYADPVQFVAYFHEGDAVHYFPRADYGVPQSLGCIELPLTDAARAWPYLAYGTLVTVIN